MADFIAGWHARIHPALAEALGYLASQDTAPESDGVLGDWLRTLCAMRFEPSDTAPIAALIGKTDPLLQEAGVKLASAAIEMVDASPALEPALVRLVSREVDGWVLEALVDLLAHSRASYLPVYQGLARIHGKPAKGPGIMRNKHIAPWRRLELVYEQHAIQTITPQPRDLAYLPILEAKHGTRGWMRTLQAILTKMGFDAEAHIAMLQRFS